MKWEKLVRLIMDKLDKTPLPLEESKTTYKVGDTVKLTILDPVDIENNICWVYNYTGNTIKHYGVSNGYQVKISNISPGYIYFTHNNTEFKAPLDKFKVEKVPTPDSSSYKVGDKVDLPFYWTVGDKFKFKKEHTQVTCLTKNKGTFFSIIYVGEISKIHNDSDSFEFVYENYIFQGNLSSIKKVKEGE